MLHIRHTAQHGKHTFWRTGIAESPGSNTPLRGMTLKLCHQILRQISETTSEQRLHDDSRDAAFFELRIKIAGIYIVIADFIGKIPIKIVEFNLHKVPMVFVVQGYHLVKHRLLAVERKAEIPDAACLALLQQIVHYAIIDIAVLELIHTPADGVEQIIVEVIHL